MFTRVAEDRALLRLMSALLLAVAVTVTGAVVVIAQQGVNIHPYSTQVLVGETRQFEVVGYTDPVTWAVVDSSAEGVGTIDQEGLFTALSGGWAIIGVLSEAEVTLATTDTVQVFGGRTRVNSRNGRAFAATDTFVVVYFPEQARERAMNVLIERRGINELPPQAQGKGTAVAAFVFTAEDVETGEPVEAFEAKVQLTLHYNDEDVPPEVSEQNLGVAALTRPEESGTLCLPGMWWR